LKFEAIKGTRVPLSKYPAESMVLVSADVASRVERPVRPALKPPSARSFRGGLGLVLCADP